MGGTCGTNEAAARIGVSWQDLKARDGSGWKNDIRKVLTKEKARIGLIWLRIGTGGGLL